MDARKLRYLMFALTLCATTAVRSETIQSRNFLVTASDPAVARQIAEAAETYRRELAIFWLGEPLPNWSRPCKLKVRVGSLGAAGQTTFQFVRGEVINWDMFVQGSLERILDSVLPHEINHTIFACHFRRPLPRWADEGAATLFEHESEQAKQLALLKRVIRGGKENFTLRQLLAMKEYPRGMRPMLILYSQGYALADFLVQQKGRTEYLKFLSDGEKMGWERAIRTHYAHQGIDALERNWTGWILAGMPKLTPATDELVASKGRTPSSLRPDLQIAGSERPEVLRAQSPDSEDSPRGGLASEFVAARDQAQPASTRERRQVQANPRPKSRTRSGGREEGSLSTKLQEPRFATIEAPEPKANTGSRSGGHATLTSPDSDEPSIFESKVASTLDAAFRQPSAQAPPHQQHLQQTASTTRADTEQSFSDPFSFSPAASPRKRNVESGSSPQWAGFPGQSKSF